MKNVASIIVTYNRLNDLQKCIYSLQKQTYNDFDIVVVNNGSTDGTTDWLEKQKDFTVINQDNLGSAGGFCTGMEYAYSHGYEWLWLMDDDGIADVAQLEKLLKGAQKYNSLFVNSLVCSIEDNNLLSFNLTYNKESISSVSKAQRYDYIPYSISPWNGTLIHKDVVRKIGYVKKEMFIWGEEVEYYRRAIKSGFFICTITDAIHYHPKSRFPLYNIFPFTNKYKIIVPPERRVMIYYKNKGYISRYNTKMDIVKELSKYVLYYGIRFRFHDLLNFLVCFVKGRRNNY